MSISVNGSARKHGIDDEDALQAVAEPLYIGAPDDQNPSKQLFLGYGKRGQLLEVVLLIFDSGNELIIHAMPCRKKYYELLGRH